MAGRNPQNSDRGRRKRPGKFHKFMRHSFPSVMMVILALLCVGVIVYTGKTITDAIKNPIVQKPSDGSEPTGTTSALETEANAELLANAAEMAAGYDYLGAIELLKTIENYEQYESVNTLIENYTLLDSQLVTYTDMDNIPHIFFHSLIADTSRAFDGDEDQDGYNQYMTTVYEFERILESLYANGYVLVSPYDVAHETTDASGNAIFTYGTIRLPRGKRPILLSQDDVNYYSYMIGTGDGKNETPVFADSKNDGFASRLVIDENGDPTCEYLDTDGNITYGDYDLVPIVETFVKKHPDFSYHGARGILGVTGYEGVFGYRTKPSYEAALGSERYAEEVAQAKAVAECLKEHGWLIASHSYGHPAYGGENYSAARVEADSDKWENTVQPIVGDTDILLYPYGSDISGMRYYGEDNAKFVALYEDGYRYFFNVDSSKSAWCQLGSNYYRGARRNIDGYRMYYYPEKMSDLLDVSYVWDPSRPDTVPPLSGAGK